MKWFPELPKYTPVKAYYLGDEFLSGLREIEIEEGVTGPSGSLNVLGLDRFFPRLSRIAHHRVAVTFAADHTSLKYLVYYDQLLHDLRSTKCPYLFVLLGDEDMPCDMTGSEREKRAMVVAVKYLPSRTRRSSGLIGMGWDV